jgi:hypothetical protein
MKTSHKTSLPDAYETKKFKSLELHCISAGGTMQNMDETTKFRGLRSTESLELL